MRSDETTATPSDDRGAAKPHRAIYPVVVPIEQIVIPQEWRSESTPSAFETDKSALWKTPKSSEGPSVIRSQTAPGEPVTNSPKESAPSSIKGVARFVQFGRFGWRNVSLGLVAAVIVAQAGLIAFWMRSGAVAAAPSQTGSVTVTSEPSGSPVLIDGIASGVTPLTLAIAPGAHRIEVGSGTQLRSQTVNVTRGGDASMHLELPSVLAAGVTGTGGLQIATQPAGARVFIDGQARGVAPLTVSDLKIGEHAVTVRNGSGEAVNRTVTVQENSVASLIISMGGSGAFASGWLAITAEVPLQIRENGALVGTTDTPRIMLPAGTHELELTNAALGYRVSRTVQISPGQTLSVGLKPPMGMLSVNAMPWADVWIDGQRAGETPIGNFAIAIGEHEVVFRHPEFGEQRKTVTVGVQAPARVGVDMRKP